MRHIIIIGILVLFSALVTGCKNISQEEFDTSLWENNIYNHLGVAPLGGSFAQEDYPFQTSMMIGVAEAPYIDGPFEVVGDEPVFGIDKMGEIEDPFLWKDESGYHMLAKDQRGTITGNRHAGILAHSKDGIHWVLDEEPLAYTREVRWSDGQTKVMGQMERVFGFIEDGQITHLFFATMDGPGGFAHGTRSWNMVIPLSD